MKQSYPSGSWPRQLAGLGLVLFVILVLAAPAAAAEPGWRPIYDKVMLWVNFFIFVFLAVKIGKKPLMNFLQGQKDEVADEIHRLQKQKNALDAKINKTRKMIEDSSVRFAEIKARIIEDGERVRQKIIEDAKAQGKNIIEIEKIKAANQIAQAKDMFLSELVDAASALALKKLPQEINENDQGKLLDVFVTNLDKLKQKAA